MSRSFRGTLPPSSSSAICRSLPSVYDFFSPTVLHYSTTASPKNVATIVGDAEGPVVTVVLLRLVNLGK